MLWALSSVHSSAAISSSTLCICTCTRRWYLDNVHPDLWRPDIEPLAHGVFSDMNKRQCLVSTEVERADDPCLKILLCVPKKQTSTYTSLFYGRPPGISLVWHLLSP